MQSRFFCTLESLPAALGADEGLAEERLHSDPSPPNDDSPKSLRRRPSANALKQKPVLHSLSLRLAKRWKRGVFKPLFKRRRTTRTSRPLNPQFCSIGQTYLASWCSPPGATSGAVIGCFKGMVQTKTQAGCFERGRRYCRRRRKNGVASYKGSRIQAAVSHPSPMAGL